MGTDNHPRIRYGMIGGGPGAFIGAVHRAAAALDGEFELVAGAFSVSEEKSRRQGRELNLVDARVSGSWTDMLEKEAARPDGERMQAVVIVTPNALHYEMARRALEMGFDVICDKPMTTTLEEAEALCRAVRDTGRVFVLTHNYTGYPMVKEARERVQAGDLGPVRKVVVEYTQGWLATRLEATGNKQASWRSNPALAGISSALGDIGTHGENLARYVTGLEMESLMADLGTMVEGRDLEDDAALFIRYEGGARGLMHVSQVAAGEENNLSLRIYGERAALIWRQEAPNELRMLHAEGPERVLRRGNAYLSAAAQAAGRIPPGHPEGFIEAFANIYRAAAAAIRTRGAVAAPEGTLVPVDAPTVQDGARGVHFIHTAVRSSRERAWVDARYEPPR